MSDQKKIGIWMDHSNAHLMELTNSDIETTIISSSFFYQNKKDSINEKEHLLCSKEQNQKRAYYKKLKDQIKDYEKIILFGPADAKLELFDFLKADPCFSNIEIDVKQADKMTKQQQHDFLREYFQDSVILM